MSYSKAPFDRHVFLGFVTHYVLRHVFTEKSAAADTLTRNVLPHTGKTIWLFLNNQIISGTRQNPARFNRKEKLLQLVLEDVRDANEGAGVNPNHLFQHIRQYDRVPIKDEPLKKHIATWLAKALGCGFVRRLVGGRYQFVTASRRQARHNQMTTSFTRLSDSRPTLVVRRPSLLTRQALNRACPVSRKLSKVNLVKMNRPMKNVDFLRRGVKFVKEKEKERVSPHAEIPTRESRPRSMKSQPPGPPQVASPVKINEQKAGQKGKPLNASQVEGKVKPKSVENKKEVLVNM
uniref:Uncharacterized protein n=1 Tax=Strigamia maritima TaxID=126957 RepID=T1IN96_STRMM